MLNLPEKYQIIEKIGQGSFGDIYKIYDKEKQRYGALKLEKLEKRGSAGMLIKEAQIMKDLEQRPGFPRLIDF